MASCWVTRRNEMRASRERKRPELRTVSAPSLRSLTSTGTVATKPRKNGIFDNVDVTKRSLLFKCLRVARSHRENTAIPSTEGLSEGHCHNPLQNNGLENGYSRITVLPREQVEVTLAFK